jgi:carboxymethylenebutenolidase
MRTDPLRGIPGQCRWPRRAEGIPPSAVDEFDAACRKAGIKHDFTVYPGAPHSFFDRKQAEFAQASADAWRRVQAFVRQHTKG